MAVGWGGVGAVRLLFAEVEHISSCTVYLRHISDVHICNVFYRKRTFGQEIKIELIIDNESRDLQLYNDSFLILIGCAKAFLFVSKRSYFPLKLQVSFGTILVINLLQKPYIIALYCFIKGFYIHWLFLSSELCPIPSHFGRTCHLFCICTFLKDGLGLTVRELNYKDS